MIETPMFANEAEEARWWFENQHVIEQAFEEEFPLPLNKVVVQALIDKEDAALAQARAESSGVTAQEYVGALLHRALHDEAA